MSTETTTDVEQKVIDRKAELKKIDASKLHIAKNDYLKEVAETLEIGYDPDNFNRGDVIAKIKEALSEVQADGRIRKVIFHNTGEGSASDVTISLNGKLLRYPKDTVVEVPEGFLKVLDEAVEYRTEVLGGRRVVRKYKTQTYEIVE